jgi:hypothetical protein
MTFHVLNRFPSGRSVATVTLWNGFFSPQQTQGILLMRLVMGCVSSVLIWVVWFIHRRTRRNQEEVLPGYRLPIEAVAAVIVARTGHLDSFLSGENGQIEVFRKP